MLLCNRCEGFGMLRVFRCNVCGAEFHLPDYPDYPERLPCGHLDYEAGNAYDCPQCECTGKDEQAYERLANEAARLAGVDADDLYFWLWFEADYTGTPQEVADMYRQRAA